MKDFYHVVIVGAGPAGLSCALNLIGSGLSVLLIDKNEHPGRKVCAGGMRLADISRLNIPEHMVWVKSRQIGTIDREDLYKCMIERIEPKSLCYHTSAKLTNFDYNAITINGTEKVEFEYLVGADGSNSLVRKRVGLANRFSLYTFQYLIENFQINEIVIDRDPSLFSCWYGWIFPHKHHAAVGCGSHSDFIKPGILKEKFKNWTDRFGIDISASAYQSRPINCDYEGYRFGNIFLVGDAAGFADEYSGEGIHQALISGEEVAQMIRNPKHSNKKLKQIIFHKFQQRRRIMQHAKLS